MLKLRVKQVIYMSQIYNDNIKRPKPQDVPLRILKFFAFYNQKLSSSRKAAVALAVSWLRLVLRLHANTSIPDIY